MFRAAAAIAVSPIVVAAVRNIATGWEPTVDAATTAVRIRDVFSVHFPWTGMAALPSSGGDELYSFPGALALYLLAVPVELFGTTWGIAIGMALINSAAALAALWLIRRRVGDRAAVVAAAFVASIAWAAGSQMLVDPMPIHMGVVPMFTLLVAAWSVAERDPPALVVLAAVANYLFLGQLKFVVIVPALVVWALGVHLWRHRQDRRADPEAWREAWRRERPWRRAAIVVTVLAWIPPLADQFFGTGNLGRIVRAGISGHVDALQPAELAPSLSGVLGMVVSVTAVPPAWLGGTLAKPPFDPLGGGTPFVVGLVCALVLAALLGWVVVRAGLLGNRSYPVAVGTGVVAWGAYVFTGLRNPNATGLMAKYFYGLWPLAAYLWMIVLLGLIQTSPDLRAVLRRRSRPALAVACAAVVVVAALAYPRADHREVQLESFGPVTKQVRVAAGTNVTTRGPVLVDTGVNGRLYRPSVLLGLQDAGIDFRFTDPYAIEQFGERRSETRRQDAVAELVLIAADQVPEGARVVGRFPLRARTLDPATFETFDAHMQTWADSLDTLELQPGPAGVSTLAGLWTTAVQEVWANAESPTTLLESRVFLTMLGLLQPSLGHAVIDVPGMSVNDMEAWANDMMAIHHELVLCEVPR